MLAQLGVQYMRIVVGWGRAAAVVASSGVNGCDDPDGLSESSRGVCLSMGSKMYGSFKHKFEVIGLKENDDPCRFAEDTH